jgi:hypothetical protein
MPDPPQLPRKRVRKKNKNLILEKPLKGLS